MVEKQNSGIGEKRVNKHLGKHPDQKRPSRNRCPLLNLITHFIAWRYDLAAILRRRPLWCRSRVGEWFCGSENGDGFALLCLGVVPVPRLRGIRQNEAGKHPPAPRSSKRASERQRWAFALSDFATGLVAIESGDLRRAAFLRLRRPLRRISL